MVSACFRMGPKELFVTIANSLVKRIESQDPSESRFLDSIDTVVEMFEIKTIVSKKANFSRVKRVRLTLYNTEKIVSSLY